jgi:glycosyltransferase involved in cell wall biosynthesis
MFTSVWAAMRSGPFDVVMGTSPPIFQSVSAWIVSKMTRRPLLLEIRDLWPDFAVDMGVLKSSILIYLSRALELFLYRRASQLLVNSPAYRDIIISKGVPGSKIDLIPNGVDPAMFDPTNTGAEIRSEFGLQKKIVVLYAGALGMANDIPTILKAAQITMEDSRIHWLLVGDGKDRARLERQAIDLGVQECTTFAGARPKSEMKQFMGAADICVATLLNIRLFRTTYPNKVFDYMAAGRPTVLGIDGVIREVIENSSGGIFVTPSTPESLAAGVIQLANFPELRQSQGASARNYVVRHFNRVNQAREFVQMIEKLYSINHG